MKFLLVGGCWMFLLLCISVVTSEGSSNSTIIKKTSNSKEVEKLSYPKKVSSMKKNVLKTTLKKISDISDKFRDLPADDLAFIKELDKQFKLYGGKVQIKVENKNVSATGKTNKRTIDGELGYGYAHNGYHYDPPKFMFYPYSQKDIDSSVSNYYVTGDGKTEVSVQPSYSYELKSQTYLTHNEPQIDAPNPQLQTHAEHLATQQQQQYEEPVIVLRIPGPAKYATHLQMLLQKYLEIRAAQYFHILEETEQRHSHQQQQQPQHQLQQLDYGLGNNNIAVAPIEQVQQYEDPHYTQHIQYEHQNAVNTASDQYPEIDNVYHSYKNRHPSHPEQAQQPMQNSQSYYATQQSEEQYTPQYESQPQHQPQQVEEQEQEQEQHHYQPEQLQFPQQVEEQPQFYYTHQQQYAPAEGPAANIYQQVYLVAMIPHGQADYEASQSQPEEQQQILVQDQQHSSSLPLAENNPRPSHTKVVFTNKNKHSPHDYQMYQLPSIKPNERHAPKSTPDYHQDFQQPQHQNLPEKYTAQESSSSYQQNYNAADTPDLDIRVNTQRPYNYHAHNVKARTRGRSFYARRAATAKQEGKGLQKKRELEAETGGAVEFKTSPVVND